MKEEQIDHLVKDYYGSIEMSESKLQNILKNTPPKDVVVPFYRKVWVSYAAAACIAFMIVSVVISNMTQGVSNGSQTALANQVIALTDRHLAPDVYSADFNSIQQGLNHSDFSIVPTNSRRIENYKVLGGRNCGFKGLKAVHVVLFNESSQKECCLYVLPDGKDLESIKDAFVNVDNHKVSLWHDNGRVFALYDPSAAPEVRSL